MLLRIPCTEQLMRMYSAGEAIGPAWDHTKAILFRDRRWQRILKICLVALVAEVGSGFGGNFNRSGGGAHLPVQARAILVPLLLLFGVLGLAISLVLLYVSSRLQFVLFDMLLLRDDRVAPAWQRHGGHTWRWIGAKVVFTLGLLVLLSPLLLPIILGFVHMAQVTAGQPAVPHFSVGIVRTFALLFAEVLLFAILFVVALRLFLMLALPTLALEDVGFVDVFARAWRLFQQDVAGMLLYAVVQPLLLLALGILVLLCWLLVTLIPAAGLGSSGWLLWHALHGGSTALILLGTIGTVATLALVAWAIVAYLFLVGTLCTFSQAYKLYFLGGRYPLLGQYLEPAPAEPTPQLGFRD